MFVVCFSLTRFTPDFTMSRVQRQLTLVTSLDIEVNYTLQATLPPHLLTKCSAAIPRPPWEPAVYNMVLLISGIVLVSTLLLSFYDASSIYSTRAAIQFSKDKVTLLDFKQLGKEISDTKAAAYTPDVSGNSAANPRNRRLVTNSVQQDPLPLVQPQRQSTLRHVASVLREASWLLWQWMLKPLGLLKHVPRIKNYILAMCSDAKSYVRSSNRPKQPRTVDREHKFSVRKGEEYKRRENQHLHRQNSSDSEETGKPGGSNQNKKQAEKSKPIKDRVPDLLVEAVEVSKGRRREQKGPQKEGGAGEEEKPEAEDTGRHTGSRKNNKKSTRRSNRKSMVVAEDALETHSQDSSGKIIETG